MRNLIKTITNKTIPRDQGAPPEQKAPDENELHVATCALLLEIAHADDDFSPEEEQRITQLMQKSFNLPSETVDQIRDMSEKKLKESIDLWQFAKTIKEYYSAEQKEQIIEMIWSVIYADGTLDKYEDHLAHKLARLLDLNHKQLIDAKVKVLRSLK